MKKLLVISGPTNVGKTSFAVELAPKLNGEIISADSRQIYRQMSIGTAKPSLIEQRRVRHHLIDIVNPNDKFTLAEFQHSAYLTIDDLNAQNKLPIIVGGTGLYIKAVVTGLKIPKVPPDETLRKQLEDLSIDQLINKLQRKDPVSAQRIGHQNKRRLIRALEVSIKLGRPFSEITSDRIRQFRTLQVGLTAPRQILYERADQGVDSWITEGWIDEVEGLKHQYSSDLPSMTSLGYCEIGMYLDGVLTLEEAIRRVKFARHSYIRRQLTWFRKDPHINWFDITKSDWKGKVEKLATDWYADG
jgi:tRNA dimethylallyltransferase